MDQDQKLRILEETVTLLSKNTQVSSDLESLEHNLETIFRKMVYLLSN